jgi:hypothetical protein
MGTLAFFLFAAAITVQPDTAALLSSCETDAQQVAQLPAGTEVQIRFALSGGAGTCYKVAAALDGKEVTGYLPKSALDGLDAFDRQREQARTLATPVKQAARSNTNRGAAPKLAASDHPLGKAHAMLQANQPGSALEMVEKYMAVNGRDFNALFLAGVAAYQADHLPRALDYLKAAQELKDDPQLAEWIEKVERDSTKSRTGEKLYGTRFQLRYEGAALPPDAARIVVATLEQEFSRIALELGCRTDERITAVVQSREAYMAASEAPEWSAGLYDGKIRVPFVTTGEVPARARQVLAHELVHACLAQMGSYPVWLHEGLAQRLSGETGSNQYRPAVLAALKTKKMPGLRGMRGSFAGMNEAAAPLAYSYSLLAVDTMMDRYRAYGIQNLLRNPELLDSVEAEIDKLLME